MVVPLSPVFDKDSPLLKHVHVNKTCVDEQVQAILRNNSITDYKKFNQWLLKAVSLIDLTTLAGDDTRSNVFRLVKKAANPLSPEVAQIYDPKKIIKTAAVCVYPNRVPDALVTINTLKLEKKIQIASVATGFPSGLYPLESRLLEISHAVSNGASEIDVVLDRSLVLTGKWESVFNEVKRMKAACKDAHLKVILGVGELGSYENVYKASMVSMMAGADFIKTSTGKEAVNATLPVGLVMCRAIRRFYRTTKIRVGLKPAGGIKSVDDAVHWLILVYTELGPEWLQPELFRIGASSLLDVIDSHLKRFKPPKPGISELTDEILAVYPDITKKDKREVTKIINDYLEAKNNKKESILAKLP